MNPNPKPDPYPNQTLTLALTLTLAHTLTLTLVCQKWYFPNNGLWLAVLDHVTQILSSDWLVINYSKWSHRWRHTWCKSRSLISCTQCILVTWPGSGLWLVDGNVNIMTSSITGLWLANRMTNVYTWWTMRVRWYTIHNVINSAWYACPLIVFTLCTMQLIGVCAYVQC